MINILLPNIKCILKRYSFEGKITVGEKAQSICLMIPLKKIKSCTKSQHWDTKLIWTFALMWITMRNFVPIG